tara:strand:+ start:115 stop:492 length:378 start_codon:yes stop_codon:yes gene_type:complete
MQKAPFTKITKEGPNMEAMIATIAKISESTIATADHLLTPERIARVEPILDALKFGGGKLSVKHNLPNTKIELTVNIDSKELGGKLLDVDLGPDPTNPNPNTKFYVQGGGTHTPIPTRPMSAARG